jgi:hypothetical protein
MVKLILLFCFATITNIYFIVIQPFFTKFERIIIPFIMAHYSSETTLSPAEIKFMDLMQHGDDFLKIELLRPAKSWYTKALQMNIETDKVKQKIAECDRMLTFEMKVIKVIVAVAVVLIAVVFILKQ